MAALSRDAPLKESQDEALFKEVRENTAAIGQVTTLKVDPPHDSRNLNRSVQGAWRQTAHWHVQGCVGKAVSPRRRVVTQTILRRNVRHAACFMRDGLHAPAFFPYESASRALFFRMSI